MSDGTSLKEITCKRHHNFYKQKNQTVFSGKTLTLKFYCIYINMCNNVYCLF